MIENQQPSRLRILIPAQLSSSQASFARRSTTQTDETMKSSFPSHHLGF